MALAEGLLSQMQDFNSISFSNNLNLEEKLLPNAGFDFEELRIFHSFLDGEKSTRSCVRFPVHIYVYFSSCNSGSSVWLTKELI